jgi:hypothetical protein
MAEFELVSPSRERLPQYAAALETGWAPNNLRNVSDVAFLRDLLSPNVPVILRDGRRVRRSPLELWWLCSAERRARFQRRTEELRRT